MHQRDIAEPDDLLDIRLHRESQHDSTQSFHRDRDTRANVRPLDRQANPGVGLSTLAYLRSHKPAASRTNYCFVKVSRAWTTSA
jgi:hypothetical protein